MEQSLFNYLTPLLFPLMPIPGSTLSARLNVQHALNTRAQPKFSGQADIEIATYKNGECINREAMCTNVVNGVVEKDIPWREFSLDGYGYVEISLACDQPIFRRIDLAAGYGIISTADYGTVTVIPDAKFARPIIIEQIRATGTFCLVHPACFVDAAKGIGNSILLANPYGTDILAKVSASTGRTIKRKVGAWTAELVSLNDVLDDGCWGCVMVTGNNRLPAWDVRHRTGDPFRVNSIDHLDVFRGSSTHQHVGARQFLRGTARRMLREWGRRIS